ncbi:hypothetical protein [Flagellimonas algicola]|uniref:Uncharacterized protein n=1 Tax=Flagellimonas algicola TaxID=2583815 RepID=A0ABY2WR53_9FLAO|nr:hypothetical protein [Allomuricauda algicola]TMU57484.1 hypothetical protein FGG15_08050 [Allomuricauda algicola]
MEIPLFLDTDNLHENPEYVRFIYWVLKIKELDFDLLCDCGNTHSSSPLKHLKLVFSYDQLIIAGLKDQNKNYHFTNAEKFENLFQIIDQYNEAMDYLYLMIDTQYVTCPYEKIKFDVAPNEDTIRGSIYRLKPKRFQLSNLLYPDEVYGWDDYEPLCLHHMEEESASYKNYLRNNRWAI